MRITITITLILEDMIKVAIILVDMILVDMVLVDLVTMKKPACLHLDHCDSNSPAGDLSSCGAKATS